MNRLIEGIKKNLSFTIFASIIYGWLHDLVTAHVCPEYFLPPHHIIIIQTESPLQLALIWGVIATWWMGAIFGFLLALAATVGSNPLPYKQLAKPITFGLISVLLLAYIVLGLKLSTKHTPFDSVLATHNFSYTASAFVGGALVAWTIYKRRTAIL